MGSPLPTPPISTSVVWYAKGKVESENQQAAIVTKIEAPGRVTLTILPPRGMPIHKQGVYYKDDPIMQGTSPLSVKQQCGVWAYPDGKSPAKAHYVYHERLLARRHQDLLDEQQRQAEAAQKRKELESGGQSPSSPPPTA
ncbi:hypothetical protein [Planctomicrobium piriforme]|nr:hypothetical protein [Planctomicrobium piriforme]